MRRLPAFWLVLALAMAPLCSGCGDDDDGGGTTGGDTAALPDGTATGTDSDVVTDPDGAVPTDDGTPPTDEGGQDEGGGEDTTQPPPEAVWTGWDNVTVYFVITDRFFDGNPANNNSYGRQPDGADEVGTFHGGDLKGLTTKLEEGYFQSLGVSAIWITSPLEQAHGWVVGGGGGFKHYGYHGYFHTDWTRLDANFGTEEELGDFVDTAHEQGIRIVMDVVMNHPGYATAVDLDEFGVDVLLPGWESATTANYYDFIDFDSDNFADWWGPQWVRADLGGNYSSPGSDVLTQSLSFLPDFKTESIVTVDAPPFFANKADTGVVDLPDTTVRGYLVTWLSRWVRDFGIDGFRCDTAKHVGQDVWADLNDAAQEALGTWRADNPGKAFPDGEYPDTGSPFWMTGEVFPHGVAKDDYYTNGKFDSLINFDYANAAGAALGDVASIDATWAEYASKINTDPDFNALSYLSSHDTSLFFDKHAGGDLEKQKIAGTLLLLTPGGVQIFYGDENARPTGPNGGDATQGTRSDYQWGANPGVLAHWQKLGRFRARHVAVGAGSHTKVGDGPYVFKRVKDDDVVYVALAASGTVVVDVSADFADGTQLRDGYTGESAAVTGGMISFPAAAEGVVLIEEAE